MKPLKKCSRSRLTYFIRLLLDEDLRKLSVTLFFSDNLHNFHPAQYIPQVLPYMAIQGAL